MNMYTKLKQHLERYAYKRGAYVGDAPACKTQRWRNTFRVVKYDDRMTVRLHSTDILTAYPDGTFEINTSGYYGYQTTTIRLNDALMMFADVYMRMCTIRKFSLSQKCMYVAGTHYRYYDGMKFDEGCNLLTDKAPFERRVVDRAESKELMEDIKQSGFREVFNVLWSQATTEDISNHSMYRLQERITNPDSSNDWMGIIAYYSFGKTHWTRSQKLDAPAAWSSIMQACKLNMYVRLPTDVYQV